MKKKKILSILLLVLCLGLNACATQTEESSDSDSNQTEEQETEQPEGVEYQNIYFDYEAEIAGHDAKNEEFTTYESADIGLSISDSNFATGVSLSASADKANTTDYYLNTLVAGNELTFSGDIQSAVSQIGSEETVRLEVSDDDVKVTPAAISAGDPVDEVITITMNNGTTYKIHTVNERMFDMEVNVQGEAEAGVYTFVADHFLTRVNTEGMIVYYRNLNCVGAELMVENFAPQDTEDGRFYTYFIELKPEMRNAMGGFSSGMYVVMDENYQEVNYITLNANDDSNHTHGEGYLDQHEFVLLSENRWIALSYTPVLAENLSGNGIDGGDTAYVHAGIIQEVEDGKVVQEINTVDYEVFYESSMEANDYENSTDQATADDIKDYVHINSVALDPKDGNYLVSMRHQYAVYKFDKETGELIWTLGGKENDFSGLDDIMDEEGNLFIGQHYARYVNSSVVENDSTITVFDNHTSFEGNTSRVIELTLDEEAKTATASIIQGTDLDQQTGKSHWATHCASVEHQSDQSLIIGWGLNAILDNNPETVNTKPIFSDYDPGAEEVVFELCVSRNPLTETSEACFSYRTYKNAD